MCENLEAIDGIAEESVTKDKWRNIFADLVFLADDKDYTPEEAEEHFDEFKEAYKDFFEREFGTW